MQTGAGSDRIVQVGLINNAIATGAGDDIVNAGRGFDNLNGGTDVDDDDLLIIDFSNVGGEGLIAEFPFENPTTQVTSYSASQGGQYYRVTSPFDDTRVDEINYINFERFDISGTNSEDFLIGGDDQDEISGNGDNDLIISNAGDDVVYGGDGDDQIFDELRDYDPSFDETLGLVFGGVDIIFGEDGNDIIYAGGDEDEVFGGPGDDFLIGGGDSDFLAGDEDQDILIGVYFGPDNNVFPASSPEIDFLTGGIGSDEFWLGDGEFVYYDDTVPDGDDIDDTYAWISDFNSAEGDLIQLYGSSSDYVISNVDGSSRIYRLNAGGTQELIAIVENVNDLDLNASYFRYVDSPLMTTSAAIVSKSEEIPLSPPISPFSSEEASAFLASEFESETDFEIISLNPNPSPSEEGLTRLDLLISLLGDENRLQGYTGLDNFEIKTTGDNRAFGIFQNDPFGLDSGVVLSTGKVNDLVGHNEIDGGYTADGFTREDGISLDFKPLPGTVSVPGNSSKTKIFYAEIPSISYIPGEVVAIKSLSLSDSNSGRGGSGGGFSGFDLDGIKISATSPFVNPNSEELISADQVNALPSLDVFDFSPGRTAFNPGTQREDEDVDVLRSLYGSLDQIVDNNFANLGKFDAFTDSVVPPFRGGFLTLGDGGTISFDFTNPITSTSEQPLYLYVGEAFSPDSGEAVSGELKVSNRPLAGLADLSTDFGRPGPEGDRIKLEISFDADATAEFIYFQFVFGSEGFVEYGGEEFNDIFDLKLNGFNFARLNDGAMASMETLVPSPLGVYHPDYVDNRSEQNPAYTETKLDGFTNVLTFVAPLIQNDRNHLEISVSDVRNGLIDSALFLKGGTFSSVAPLPIDRPPIVINPIEVEPVRENAFDTIIDLTNVFTDYDNDDAAIVKSVLANDNPSLVTATISDNDLILDYQPEQNGMAEITIQATSNGQTVEDTFTVTVNPAEDVPVAVDDLVITDEDTILNGNVLVDNGSGVDSDPEGNPLTITAVNRVTSAIGTEIVLESGALLTLNTDGTFSYNPNDQFDFLLAGETTTDSFTYTISDGTFGGVDTATVTVTITGVNDFLEAIDDDVSTDEDVILNGNVFVDNGGGPDSGPDGGFLTIAVNGETLSVGNQISLDSGAFLTLNADGTFAYDPNGQFESLGAGEIALELFTYTIGTGDSTVDLSDLDGTNGFTINGIAPSDLSGYSVSGAGDINGDGIDDLLIGSFRADPNGNEDAGESYVVFGNNAAFSGSLELSSLDGSNGFTIRGLASGDRLGRSVSNAGDVNGDGIDDIIIGAFRAGKSGRGANYVVFNSTNGCNDSVSYDPNGRFEALAAGETATDSFTYTLSDGNGGTDTAGVTVTITGENDAPVAFSDVSGTVENTAVTINVAANDRDIDGNLDPSTVTVVSGPSNGTFTNNGDGTLTYLPNAGYTGKDVLAYSIQDSLGATSDPVNVKLDIIPNTVAIIIGGIAIDSYLAGATVFLDANGNGVLDDGEPNTTTGYDGLFELVTSADLEISSNARLILRGGIDTVTELPFEGILTALPNSSIISPLTTAIATLVEGGVTESAAESAVKAAFGLPAEVDLASFNAIAAIAAGDATGLKVFAAQTSLQNTVTQLSSLIAGAETQVSNGDIIAIAFEEIAEQVSTGTLYLTDPAQIATLATKTIQNLEAEFAIALDAAAAIAGEAATVIANSNQETVDATEEVSDINLATIQIAQIQQVSASTAEALAAAVTGTQPIEAVVEANTGANLETRIQNASVNATVAYDDRFSIFVGDPFTGNVLVDNSNGADLNLAGDPLAIAAVNGSTIDLGHQITLPSGAFLTQINTSILIYK